MKKILVILPLLILCFVYGCKKEEQLGSYASFKASSVEVSASTIKYGIQVVSNLTKWTLTQDDGVTWVKILGEQSRDSSATIYIEMEKNPSLVKRTTKFTLSFMLEKAETRTLELTQLGETKVIIIGADTLYMPAAGGLSVVKINSNLEWTAISSLPFVTVESDGLAKAVVEKDLKLNFSQNNELGFRISNISVKAKDSDQKSDFVAYQYGLGDVKTDSLALVALYNATGGVNWSKKWDLTKPLKTWTGVKLSATKGGLRVTQLNLAENNLLGEIPVSITDLSYLEELALQENKLNGVIPKSIDNLYFLRYLYLQGNELTGTIPTELANIPYLDRIHLGRNLLSGSIPNEIGNLKYLRVFCVESNNLSGALPEQLGASKTLQIIYVYDNKLTGNIPNTYMKNIMWRSWNVKVYICPQQNGFAFNNCPL